MKTKVVSLVIFVLLLVNNTIYQANAGNSNLVNNSKFNVYCPEFPDANLNQSYIDLTNITIKMVDGNIKLINGDKATIDEFNNAVKDIKFKNSIKQQLTEGKKLIGIISVNIVVAERYKTISNKIICNESRLLSSDEVAEIKATNSDTINSLSLSYVGSDNDVKYELYLNFAVYQVTPTNYAAEYELYGIASWDSIGFDVMEHPAIGEDFLGFAWGGGFSQKAQEALSNYLLVP